MTTPTLSAVLAALGWSQGLSRYDADGRRLLCSDTGVELGTFTESEVWELLRERGLYDTKPGAPGGRSER